MIKDIIAEGESRLLNDLDQNIIVFHKFKVNLLKELIEKHTSDELPTDSYVLSGVGEKEIIDHMNYFLTDGTINEEERKNILSCIDWVKKVVKFLLLKKRSILKKLKKLKILKLLKKLILSL